MLPPSVAMTEGMGYALLLSLGAGLATGIGSAIAFFYKRANVRFMSFALGLSAGVMLYISFMDLLYESRVGIAEIVGSDRLAILFTALAFFGGMGLTALIDAAIPETENPHRGQKGGHVELRRASIVTAAAIAVHNFPEGIATFVSGLEGSLGGISIAVAVAIAIHNIPEGIAVSVPIFASTGSRNKAFWISFASGLAEPLGALVAWGLLLPIISPLTINLVFAAVAGIMVFISLDELLPAAHEYSHSKISIVGLTAGMAIMAASMYLLA